MIQKPILTQHVEEILISEAAPKSTNPLTFSNTSDSNALAVFISGLDMMSHSFTLLSHDKNK